MSWTIQILNVANIKLLLVAENSCQETKKNKKKTIFDKTQFLILSDTLSSFSLSKKYIRNKSLPWFHTILEKMSAMQVARSMRNLKHKILSILGNLNTQNLNRL